MGDIGDTRASKEGSQGCLLGGGGGWGVGEWRGGGASRDSTGLGALEEGLISS